MRVTVGVLVALVFAAAARGQEAPVSLIESEGIATVDALPGHVDFWLHRRAEGETLAQATQGALELHDELREQLQTRNLKHMDLMFSDVAIPRLDPKVAHVSARVRFNATSFSTAEEGPQEFAALCDTIIDLAATLKCAAEGPILGVTDADAVEEAAIARAIEKAYPAGKAAAQTMNGQVVAVDKVTIIGTQWNASPDTKAMQPDVRRMTCTAKVKVVYAFAAGQP